jgi:CheY-like chemotaxis protein
MGGDAGVESTPGLGSRFWFTARLRKGATAATTPSAQASDSAVALLLAHHAGRRVLLVEDDLVNREVALCLLEDTGLHIDQAGDGIEALELASRNRYDLILMDMQMPHMDGLEATRQIRRLYPSARLPIIALTANAFAEDKALCLEAGMDDFIGKPIDPDLLYQTLLDWLERAR